MGHQALGGKGRPHYDYPIKETLPNNPFEFTSTILQKTVTKQLLIVEIHCRTEDNLPEQLPSRHPLTDS